MISPWKFFTLLVVVFGLNTACHQQMEQQKSDLNDAEPLTATLEKPASQTGEPQSFGKKIHAGQAMAIEEAVDLLNSQDSLMIKIEGIANSSCQMKGCWMMVDLPGEQDMRVTFKDYSYFVPKDLSGEKVVLEGVLKKSIESVEDLKHYAKDAGKTDEEIASISAPLITTTFVAEGVLIYRN